jgi:hypothetical protein
MLQASRAMAKRPEALGLLLAGGRKIDRSGGYCCTYLSATADPSHATVIPFLETDTSRTSGGLSCRQCNVFPFLELQETVRLPF